MARIREFEPAGVVAATEPVSHDDPSIGEAETRRRAHAAVMRGISAVANGHSSEAHAGAAEGRRRVPAMALDQVGNRLPRVGGLHADGGLNAARMAEAELRHSKQALGAARIHPEAASREAAE